MRVSVIIPTHNRKDFLRRCLVAVTTQDYPDYEVIVVDDGSTDGTDEMVRREFPQVRYIRQEPNRGPAAARNRGIEVATGEIIAFTDDDCVAPQGWLRSHLGYYKDQKVGAVGGVQLPQNPSFFDKFEIAHYADVYSTFRRITAINHIGGLATNNLSIRRKVFAIVGLFDTHFLTGSDPELTRRVAMAGYVLIHDPTIRVEHLKVHSFHSYLKMRFRRGCGSILNDVKYNQLSVRRFIPIINPYRTWKDWRAFHSLFGGHLGHFVGFWAFALFVRWVDVGGRLYYYWKIGRHYPRIREAVF